MPLSASSFRRAFAAVASTLATATLVAAEQPATPIGTLDGHTEAVYSVAWTPDGKSLVTGGFDQTVRLWDVASKKEIKRYDGHNGLVLSVAVDKDGKRILSGGLDKTAKVWEIPPSGPSKTLAEDHPAAIRAIALEARRQTASPRHREGRQGLGSSAKAGAAGPRTRRPLRGRRVGRLARGRRPDCLGRQG